MTDQPAKPTIIRLDPALRPEVDAYAKETHRSLNGSVNYLVQWALAELARRDEPKP